MKNIHLLLLIGLLFCLSVHLSAQTRVVDEAVFEKISKTVCLKAISTDFCSWRTVLI